MRMRTAAAAAPVLPAALLALLLVALAQATPAAAQEGGVIERALASRAKGGEDARVLVLEIADFECPYCARFARTVMPQLDSAYVRPGRVQWVFVNLPLHTHPNAWVAAEAALCAGATAGRFWGMHDRLFASQAEWTGQRDPARTFARYARELGVPAEPYRACVARDQVATVLLQDVTSALSAQVSGTPTFLVMRDGGILQSVVGVRSFEEWSRLLDAALEGR